MAPLEDAVEAPAPEADPEAIALGRDLLEGLQGFLQEHLPERGRLVLVAIYEDQLEPAKAAQMMGVSVQVVYNWQHKIRNLIRDYCAEAGVAV